MAHDATGTSLRVDTLPFSHTAHRPSRLVPWQAPVLASIGLIPASRAIKLATSTTKASCRADVLLTGIHVRRTVPLRPGVVPSRHIHRQGCSGARRAVRNVAVTWGRVWRASITYEARRAFLTPNGGTRGCDLHKLPWRTANAAETCPGSCSPTSVSDKRPCPTDASFLRKIPPCVSVSVGGMQRGACSCVCVNLDMLGGCLIHDVTPVADVWTF